MKLYGGSTFFPGQQWGICSDNDHSAIRAQRGQKSLSSQLTGDLSLDMFGEVRQCVRLSE